MSGPGWQLTYNVQNHSDKKVIEEIYFYDFIINIFPLQTSKIEVVRRMERNIKLKEERLFSQKCKSQILASELFPLKNECKKFNEKCKMNFFFPDADNIKIEEIAKVRRQKQMQMLKNCHSLN